MPIDYLQAAEDQFREADGQTMGLPRPIDASTWLESEPPEPDQIITDIFDVKDKLAIIAASKLKKTFFLLQLLLSIAAGIPFLSWVTPKPRRVFHIQYEIQENHYHRRLRRMARAMGITSSQLGDRFQILNARGLNLSGLEGIEKITAIVRAYNPNIISFDPLYKVAAGVENAAEDMKIILNAFDKLAEETGAAIIYIHHDAKGFSGDRDIRDRGAGSNVLGRDYDACITLTPHVTESDAAIVDVLLRNYRPQEPFTALWTEDEDTRGYKFELRPDIAPTRKTSSNGRIKDLPALNSYLPAAFDILKLKPLTISNFTDLFRTKTGTTHERTKAFKRWAVEGEMPALNTIEKRSRGVYEKLIGTSEQITRLMHERSL
jgi:hypothetical protein